MGILLLGFVSISLSAFASDEPPTIPDAQLRRAIEAEIEVPQKPSHPCVQPIVAPDLLAQLQEWRQVETMGMGISKQAFGTTLYHTSHGFTMKGYPEIARDARAILIGFGGAGVMSASGRTFMGDGNVYKKYGVSVVSFDYPFHANGPRDEQWWKAGNFMSMCNSIVRHYEKTGLPVYLMGHSFGPTPIQELLYHSPGKVRGAIYLSPGGSISPEQGEIYSRLVSSGELPAYWDSVGIIEEPQGEPWSNTMEKLFKANKGQDLNIRVPLELMVGEHDLYSTADSMRAFADRYPALEVDIIHGVGHDIFSARGQTERYVTERALKFIGRIEGIQFWSKEGNVWKTNYVTTGEPLAHIRYFFNNSSLFRSWFSTVKRIPMSVIERDQSGRKADGIIKEWKRYYREHVFRMAVSKFRNTPNAETLPELTNIRKILDTTDPHSFEYSAEQILVSFLLKP